MDRTATEDQLVKKAQGGDQRAFLQLVRATDDDARALAYGMLGSRTAMDDVTASAYASAWSTVGAIDGTTASSTWLLRIVLRRCRETDRSQSRSQSVAIRVVADAKSPGDSQRGLASADIVRRSLNSLKPENRAAMLLIDGMGREIAEAGSIVGTNRNTLSDRVMRARQAMRTSMLEDAEGDAAHELNSQDPTAATAAALATLGGPPEHRLGFWDELDAQISGREMVVSAGPKKRAWYQSETNLKRLGAAVVAALVIGFGLGRVLGGSGNDTESVTGATTTAASSSTTTTVRPVTTTATPATTQPATPPTTVIVQETIAPVTAPPGATTFVNRVESTLFLYDVGVPEGWSIGFGGGRGINANSANYLASIQSSNYFRGDNRWQGFTAGYEGEAVVSEETLSLPLYVNGVDGVTESASTIAVDQFQFSGGFTDGRVVRIYGFPERTVMVELTFADGELGDLTPAEILDDIRMFTGSISLVAPCSTFGQTAPAPPAVLNPAQTARLAAIGQALVACNWIGLQAQLDPAGFSADFGAGVPIPAWQDAERYEETILTSLLEVLRTTPSAAADGSVSWPRAAGMPWNAVTDEMKAELTSIGYSEQDQAVFAAAGEYKGYRTGLTADGLWQFFISG